MPHVRAHAPLHRVQHGAWGPQRAEQSDPHSHSTCSTDMYVPLYFQKMFWALRIQPWGGGGGGEGKQPCMAGAFSLVEPKTATR